MPGIREKTEELIDVIKHSKEYRSYNELRALLLTNPDLKTGSTSFRTDCVMLQNNPNSDPESFSKSRTGLQRISLTIPRSWNICPQKPL